jgi:altronate dehydratase
VIKVAGNPAKVRLMKDHIDLDASGVLSGEIGIDEVGRQIYKALLAAGSGKKVKAETLKYDQTVEIYTTGPTI